MRYATRRRKTVAERLWSKVQIKGPDECWPWVGAHDSFGYGVMLGDAPECRQVSAHRAMWLTKIGPIPAGYDVRQSCRDRNCVNPAHLRLWGRRGVDADYALLASGAAPLVAAVIVKAIVAEQAQTANPKAACE